MLIDELQFFQAAELREGKQYTKICSASAVELVIVEVLAQPMTDDVAVKGIAVKNDEVVIPAIAALIMAAGAGELDVLCHQNLIGNMTTFGEPMLVQQLQDRDEYAYYESLDEKSADWLEWSADDTSERSVAVEAVI